MNKTVLLLLAVALILLAGLVFIFLPQEKVNAPGVLERPGIEIFSPTPNEVIESPLKISGMVSGNGWTGFEGQVGTVTLLDEQSTALVQTFLPATTEWMALPVAFEKYIAFTSPKEQKGVLVFHNENASGLPEHDREFLLNVTIARTQGQLATVKAYFINTIQDPEVSCDKVFPIEREVPKTEAIARAALGELLKGLTPMEKNAGFATSINQGVAIQSLVIENGIAKVDFSEALQKGVAGSCKVIAIRAQITQTLKQFSTVKEVIISIDGNTEDILQP